MPMIKIQQIVGIDMKVYLFLWLVLVNVTGLSAKELKIGYFLTTPHVIATGDDHHPRGVVIDLWEKVAKKTGDSIFWMKMPLARVIKELEANRLDGSSAFIPTPSRREKFIFTASILDMVQPAIVVHKENKLNKLTNKDDLKDLVVGYFISGVVTPWFKQNNIEFELIAGSNALVRLLVQLSLKRVDAVYWPTISAARYDARRLSFENKFKYIKSPMGPYPLKPMFSKNKIGKKLAKDFDAVFNEVKEEYNIAREKERYINGEY